MADAAARLNPKAAEQLGSAMRFIAAVDRAGEDDLTATPIAPLLTATLAETMKVKSRDDKSIGTIHAFMVHKRSNRAMYAVLSLGGFLGLGRAYYAIPITLLIYDAATDNYVVPIESKVLEGGPSWATTAPTFDQDYADRVAAYYGVDRQDMAVG